MNTLKMVALGGLFGFILVRVDATSYDAILGMFALTDLHLMGVIGTAIAVAGVGLWWLRRRGIAGPAGCKIPIEPKARKPGNLVGGAIFGVGWALTGTCPGTALAQLGEGTFVAAFTIAGILLGTALYRRIGGPFEAALSRRGIRRGRAPAAFATGSSG